MPVSVNEFSVDPDDPDGAFRRLSHADSAAAGATLAEPSSWVEPDYSTVAREAEISGPGPHLNWPGPPLVMPAGMLPDGQPPGRDEMDNAARIEGVRPRSAVEADACVRAYMRQQNHLRRQAGIPRAFRDASGLRDMPEAAAAIAELHQQERVRRQRRAS